MLRQTTGTLTKSNGNMLTYIIIYVSIGVLLNVWFDLLVNEIEKDEDFEDDVRFTNAERIVSTLTWPWFLYQVYKSMKEE